LASEKILQEKQAYVATLTEKLQNAVAGVIVSYKGITVEEDTALRRKMREAGVDYAVVKNTMLRRAAENVGLSELNGVLEGSTALAVSTDYTAAAKILCEYAEKSDTFEVKAGFIDGEVIDAARVQELSKLPSKEGLLSMLLSVLNGPIRGLAVALNAIVEKNGGETASADEAPAEEAPAAEEAAPAEAPAEEAPAAEEAAAE